MDSNSIPSDRSVTSETVPGEWQPSTGAPAALSTIDLLDIIAAERDSRRATIKAEIAAISEDGTNGVNTVVEPLSKEAIERAWWSLGTEPDGGNLAGGTNLEGWTRAIRWAEQQHGIPGVPVPAPILGYRVDASYFQKWESIPKALRYKAIPLVAAAGVPVVRETKENDRG